MPQYSLRAFKFYNMQNFLMMCPISLSTSEPASPSFPLTASEVFCDNEENAAWKKGEKNISPEGDLWSNLSLLVVSQKCPFTGNYIQYLVIIYNEKEYEKVYIYTYICIYMCVYIYVCVNHFAVHQKLTQHCKSTILQFKKKKYPLSPYPAGTRAL